MGDEFSKLSAEDQAKLALLEKEWERDGDAAIVRFAESEPITCLRLIALWNSKAVRDAIENAVIDQGLTNAEIHAMLEKMLRERKH